MFSPPPPPLPLLPYTLHHKIVLFNGLLEVFMQGYMDPSYDKSIGFLKVKYRTGNVHLKKRKKKKKKKKKERKHADGCCDRSCCVFIDNI